MIVNPGQIMREHSATYLKNRLIRTDGLNTGAYPYERHLDDELFFINQHVLRSFKNATLTGDWQYIGFKPFRHYFTKFVITNYLVKKGVELKFKHGNIYARCMGSAPYEMYVGDEIMKEKK